MSHFTSSMVSSVSPSILRIGAGLVLLAAVGCGNSDAPPAGDPLPIGQQGDANPAAPAIGPGAVQPANAAPASESLATKIERSRRQMAEQLDRYKKTKQIATVIVRGVPGDEADASRFVYGVVSREVGKISQADQKQAREQTARNEQAARDEALRQNAGHFGIVTYEYRIAEDQYGYAYTWNSGIENGTYAYVVHPAPDLDALGKSLARLGPVAKIDNSTRQIEIQAAIPTPIPDLAIEAAQERHGSQGYAVIEIRSAPGNVEDVQYYLEQQIKQLKGVPEKTFSVDFLRQLPNDGFKFLVRPVPPDLNEFAAQIEFGKIVGAVESVRTILVTAQLPSEIPKKPSREEIWEMEAEERRNRPTVWDTSPKKGESPIDWALRIMKEGVGDSRPAVYKYLANVDPDPEQRERVAAALVDCIKNDVWLSGYEDFPLALARWQTEATETQLIERLTEDKSHRKEMLITALENVGTEKAARAIATQLTDFFNKEQAFTSLKRMGTAAEPIFIDYLKDNNPQARLESAQLLGQIGTERALKALKSLITTERIKEVKAAARFAVERIEERLAAAAPDTTENGK